MRLAAMVVGLVLVVSGWARAQDGEFVLGLGYAHLELDGPNVMSLDDEDGFRIEPRFSWALDGSETLRLGFGVGVSGYRDEDDSPGGVFDPDDYESLVTITPEMQLSLRFFPGEVDWFIEPGAGLGPIIGNYRRGETVLDFDDDDIDTWRVGFGARPFLRAGYDDGDFVAGVEASYQFGNVDFGDGIGDDIEELYVGFFVGLKF